MIKSKDEQVAVLLRKDWLILKRNWAFLIMFTLLPVIISSAFWYMWASFDAELSQQKHNLDQTKYAKIDHTQSSFLESGMSNRLRPSDDYVRGNLTALSQCMQNQRKDIGLIGPRKIVSVYEPFMRSDFAEKKLNLNVFESVKQLFDEIVSDESKKYCFAFEMGHISPSSDVVNITVYRQRDDIQGLLKTEFLSYDASLRNPDWSGYNKTFKFGEPHLMIQLTDFVLMMMRGQKFKELELAFVPMMTPEFQSITPQASSQIRFMFPFFYLSIFIVPLHYISSRIAEEKEHKAREGMKIMGLTDAAYYKSWFVFNLLLMGFTCFLATSIMQLDVLSKSDRSLVFVMSLSHCCQLFGFTFALAALLPNKQLTSTATILLHMATNYMIHLMRSQSSLLVKCLLSFVMPNAALGLMLDQIIQHEIIDGVGLTLNQTAFTPSQQNFSFAMALVCQIICSTLWAAMGIYLDKTMPREFGTYEKWDYLWNQQQPSKRISSQAFKRATGTYEDIPDQPGVSKLEIRGLSKQYENGTQAVNDVNLTMHAGQVFALLGHNGAGKTSLINMLTGLTESTEGQATLDELEFFQGGQMTEIRKLLGFCPQHNVLFPELTVRDHLELFSVLKSSKADSRSIVRQVDKMISQIELEDVQNQRAISLSGGQKRKLSVGIALIGDKTKLVFLDEPTSGMDTTTRRKFWSLIKEYRRDKIILLTTHYMDEADVLGDQICIMAGGQVQACGSSMFLKQKYGCGYTVKMTRTNDQTYHKMKAFVQQCDLKAQVLEQREEVILKVPETERRKFKSFFQRLDRALPDLGIDGYGVSLTSLEEVFLQIGGAMETKDQNQAIQKPVLVINHYSYGDEIKAHLIRKVQVQLLHLKNLVCDLLLPCLLILLSWHLSTLNNNYLLEAQFQLQDPHLHSLSAFPQQTLTLNTQNFNQSDLSSFTHNAFSKDLESGVWLAKDPLTLAKKPYFDQLRDMDKYLFSKNEAQFVQPFIQQARQADRAYSLASFVNVTQPCVIGAAGYLLQAAMRDQLDKPGFQLNFYEARLPFSYDFLQLLQTTNGFIVMAGLVMALFLVQDSQVATLQKEKTTGVKHLITLDSLATYWLSNYMFDFAFSLAIGSIVASGDYEVFKLTAVFALCNPLFVYCAVLCLPGLSLIFIRVQTLVFGLVLPILTQVYMVQGKKCGYMLQIGSISPIYNLAFGYLQQVNKAVPQKQARNYSAQATMINQIYFFLILAVMIESGLLDLVVGPVARRIKKQCQLLNYTLQVKKQKQAYDIREVSSMLDYELFSTTSVVKIPDDEDVVKEAQRITTDSQVLVRSLSKAYGPIHKAVDNVSFALQQGESFALLGVTGAGKTTTFKCLCGEERPDSGLLQIAGCDTTSVLKFRNARNLLGYCPQFDALYDNLTVTQHLHFYAALKGIHRAQRLQAVDYQIQELDLQAYKQIEAGKLSGGNRRKLMCAIALLGRPQLVLLDEPSTGVDPKAKRKMWTAISQLTQNSKTTVVLTTHSMDEAEALCPQKMGIMVDGKFKCYGSAQHLITKYSQQSYGLEVKLKELSLERIIKELPSGVQIQSGSQLNDKQVREMLDKAGWSKVWDLCVSDGDLTRIFRQQAPFKVEDVLQWAHLQHCAILIRDYLQTEFTGNQCDLTDHFSTRFLFKLSSGTSKGETTIGSIFGVFESLKEEYSWLEEYSVSQTTLEQIFNMFANQKNIDARLRKNQVTTYTLSDDTQK